MLVSRGKKNLNFEFLKKSFELKKDWELIRIFKQCRSNKYFYRSCVTVNHLFEILAWDSCPSWSRSLILCHAGEAAQVSSGKEISSESFLGGVKNSPSVSHPIGGGIWNISSSFLAFGAFELVKPVVWNIFLFLLVCNLVSWVSAALDVFQES